MLAFLFVTIRYIKTSYGPSTTPPRHRLNLSTMIDPKEELGARFENRQADPSDEELEKSSKDEEGDNITRSNTTNNAGGTGTTDNSYNTGYSSNTDSTSKPGPDPDTDSTRNRRQVSMHLPEAKADQLNDLYDRLDGQSKVAGDGGMKMSTLSRL